MPRNKRKLLRGIFAANGGCGNCGSPKAFDVYDPTPKPKFSSHPIPNPTVLTSPSIIPHEVSVDDDDDHHHHHVTSPSSITGKLSGSIFVEMKSENPYNDFKESIIQMIIERDIYSSTELRELLHCFLKLNLPCHHQLILKAFSDSCQQSSSPRVSPQAP